MQVSALHLKHLVLQKHCCTAHQYVLPVRLLGACRVGPSWSMGGLQDTCNGHYSLEWWMQPVSRCSCLSWDVIYGSRAQWPA